MQLNVEPADSTFTEPRSSVELKWVNRERTQTLAGMIAAQIGSLQNLITYETAAAIGMLSSSGFIRLVTDFLASLRIIATHGAGTLPINEGRQALSKRQHRARRYLRPCRDHACRASKAKA